MRALCDDGNAIRQWHYNRPEGVRRSDGNVAIFWSSPEIRSEPPIFCLRSANVTKSPYCMMIFARLSGCAIRDGATLFAKSEPDDGLNPIHADFA